jgi:predicted RNA binding protein YcfA (HicA-like mRNA interferase family)
MSRLPILSGKELIRILKRAGYQEVRQRGSHIRLVCPGRKPITVPDYKTIDRTLLRKILRDAELSPEQFDALMN